MADITRHLTITGRVQGVFYRDWAVEAARGLGLSGWVRNRRDGSVEAVASGSQEAVARFVERCREGSPAAGVTGVTVSAAPDERFAGFGKRPTA